MTYNHVPFSVCRYRILRKCSSRISRIYCYRIPWIITSRVFRNTPLLCQASHLSISPASHLPISPVAQTSVSPYDSSVYPVSKTPVLQFPLSTVSQPQYLPYPSPRIFRIPAPVFSVSQPSYPSCPSPTPPAATGEVSLHGPDIGHLILGRLTLGRANFLAKYSN